MNTVKATNRIPMVSAPIPNCSKTAIRMMKAIKPPVYIP
jgi:hypothetical protein